MRGLSDQLNARPIGVLWAVDANEGERDDKIVCVPKGDPSWDDLSNAEDLPGALADEIVHFTVHGDMEGKQLGLDGWGTHDDATQLIEKGRRRASRVEQ